MVFQFSQHEAHQITKHFGRAFYEKACGNLRLYSNKWKLDIEEMIDYYSVNCIFICRSEQYGPAVLKIGGPGAEARTEANFLKEYNGGRFCKMYKCDADNGILLEERVTPGTRLRQEPSLEKRLSVFSNLFNGLHIQSRQSEQYPTYVGWVKRITEYMSERADYKDLYKLMLKASGLCSALCVDYPKQLLLHGDLHHDNILLGEHNEYKIIDPKGVIGDPIFDIPRFILNEFYNREDVPYEFYRSHVTKVLCYLQKSLGVPMDVMKKALFIETAMANCWNVESGEELHMHSVRCAEALLDEPA